MLTYSTDGPGAALRFAARIREREPQGAELAHQPGLNSSVRSGPTNNFDTMQPYCSLL